MAQPKQVTHYAVQGDLLVVILDYLSLRPYKEVERMITELQQARPVMLSDRPVVEQSDDHNVPN